MIRRPAIAPDAAAALLAAAPARLARRLDAEPAMAEVWLWAADDDRWTVTTDKGEVVSLAAPAGLVVRADDVACSCLLGPRCLHVVAVIARLPVADAPTAPRGETAAPAEPTAAAAPAVRAAAASAFRVGAALLAGGASGAGAVRIAELLRVIHGCRAAGAHRIAAAGARVARSIQDLHGDRAAFSLTTLTGDLAELLTSSHVVATSESVATAWLGTARRVYEPVGNLRLHGVFTEAVVARTGYAGAVTYLVDAGGHLYTRSDVAPGDIDRACAAYDAPAALGDAVLSHRELGRAGLFVSGATASRDGRLGAGASVKAARAQEPSRWTDPPVAALWARPLAEQVERLIERATGDDEPAAGWDLVFATGTVRGIRQGAVIDRDRRRPAARAAPGAGLRPQPPSRPRHPARAGPPPRSPSPRRSARPARRAAHRRAARRRACRRFEPRAAGRAGGARERRLRCPHQLHRRRRRRRGRPPGAGP
jgi:hypothetical protein